MTPVEKYRSALAELLAWKAKEFPVGTKVKAFDLEATIDYGESCMINGDYYELKPDEIIVYARGHHDAIKLDDITKV